MRDSLDQLLGRVRGEFAEMPGLSLTERQAARLWQIDGSDLQHALQALVDAHFLTFASGQYRRTSTV